MVIAVSVLLKDYGSLSTRMIACALNKNVDTTYAELVNLEKEGLIKVAVMRGEKANIMWEVKNEKNLKNY